MFSSSYNPIGDDENSELLGEEAIPEAFLLQTVENQDAAFATRLADQEAVQYRQQEIEANARSWDPHYRYLMNSSNELKISSRTMNSPNLIDLSPFEFSRPNPYYYGTWRGPSSRPTIAYRDVDDPRVELYTFM